MHREHPKTLGLIVARSVPERIKWRDIEALLVALGAEISKREGSRVGVKLLADRSEFRPLASFS